MLENLQKKWKVGATQLLLIICTFAIGGSLTGYASKRIMNLLPVERGAWWIVIYVVIVTVLWPFSVLLISLFFGQYRFFSGYLRKMGTRMGIIKKKEPVIQHRHRIAIFASGAGSNAKKIIEYFKDHEQVEVALVVCNKPGAGVLTIAADSNIPSIIIDKEKFFRGDGCVSELHSHSINFIVLAGFLWKVPSSLIDAYNGKIINIHPALLPAYGGKGMYGQHVHTAVILAKEKESGISIHYVDGKYDNGEIIFQARCAVTEADTPDTLAQKIHALEHAHYPRVIAEVLTAVS